MKRRLHAVPLTVSHLQKTASLPVYKQLALIDQVVLNKRPTRRCLYHRAPSAQRPSRRRGVLHAAPHGAEIFDHLVLFIRDKRIRGGPSEKSYSASTITKGKI